jgi:hypothetical protein
MSQACFAYARLHPVYNNVHVPSQEVFDDTEPVEKRSTSIYVQFAAGFMAQESFKVVIFNHATASIQEI